MALHLVLALSSHGFGHIGQTAPVIEALRERIPDLRVTLRTTAPYFKLTERFGKQIDIVIVETDVGMVQQNAQSIAWESSAHAYRKFHQDWERRVEAEARALNELHADALLANVPYLPLAGAQHAGIPAIALCSINWMDIYAHFFSARSEAQDFLEQMAQAYTSVRVFLQPTPSMPMRQLTNLQEIGPICQCGHSRRAWFMEHLGLRPDERLVMVSLGGMELRPPVEQWPTAPGVRLLVPSSWNYSNPNIIGFEDLGISYVDALWSCDALICKPGYGSFVEAACAGIPVLYLERPDWPETPYLVRWLKQVGRCDSLSQEQWWQGDFIKSLERLWCNSPQMLTIPTGVSEAVNKLLDVLKAS